MTDNIMGKEKFVPNIQHLTENTNSLIEVGRSSATVRKKSGDGGDTTGVTRNNSSENIEAYDFNQSDEEMRKAHQKLIVRRMIKSQFGKPDTFTRNSFLHHGV